jgi:hypothetical protein
MSSVPYLFITDRLLSTFDKKTQYITSRYRVLFYLCLLVNTPPSLAPADTAVKIPRCRGDHLLPEMILTYKTVELLNFTRYLPNLLKNHRITRIGLDKKIYISKLRGFVKV